MSCFAIIDLRMPKTKCQVQKFTIGELAEQAGVNLQTIRYYESLGLIPEPARTESGYRTYDESYIKHIRFVKNSQDLGFSLEEIQEMASIKLNPKASGKAIKEIIRKKIAEVDNTISTLIETKKYLEELDTSCSGRMLSPCCPIIASLNDN